MEKYFIALEPEPNLRNLILNKKKTIFDKLGPQTYLSHPPHTTLICFTTNEIESLVSRLERISTDLGEIPITLSNLHIFYDDVQTQGHTITYSFSEQNVKKLKEIQKKIAVGVLPFNTMNFLPKDSPTYEKLSGFEKDNVTKFGFPFIGENWIPHITLASINKIQLDESLEMIKMGSIFGDYFFSSLSLYKIDEELKLLRTFPISNYL